jgi:DNA primase
VPSQETRLLRTKSKLLDLEGIKRIPIATIAADLGIRIKGFGSTNCPFPDHADKKPSFQLRGKANAWKCYGCGRGGSTIDLVMQLNGWDFVEASKWLQDRYIRGFSSRQSKSIIKSVPKAQPSEPCAYFYDAPIYDWL